MKGTSSGCKALAAGIWAMLAVIPTSAQITGERIAPPADPQFVLGYAIEKPAPMEEYVPRGETVQTWTRMITLQVAGYRPGWTPGYYLTLFANRMRRSCPGVVSGSVRTLEVGGRSAADARFDCPRNPRTGKPESMIGRVILGNESLHMIQVAFRKAPDAGETAWANKVIAESIFCARDSREPRCTRSGPNGPIPPVRPK